MSFLDYLWVVITRFVQHGVITQLNVKKCEIDDVVLSFSFV